MGPAIFCSPVQLSRALDARCHGQLIDVVAVVADAGIVDRDTFEPITVRDLTLVDYRFVYLHCIVLIP